MKYDFWKNIQIDDKLFYYDTDEWKIKQFIIIDIQKRSTHPTSFIIETNNKKHPYIFVNLDRYSYDGIVNTFNHMTYKQIFINEDNDALIEHYKNELKTKINTLENSLFYYNKLLKEIT